MLREKARLEQELECLKLVILRSKFHKLGGEINDAHIRRWHSEGHLPGQEIQNETSPVQPFSEQTTVCKAIGQIDFDLETVEQVVRIKHIVDQMHVYIREMQYVVGARITLVEQGTPANEAEILRKLVTELHRINDRTYKDLQSLLLEMRGLEKNMGAAEHKASLCWVELNSLRLKLEKAQVGLNQMHEKEEDYRQKLAHLEYELKDSQSRSEDFRLNTEALSQDCLSGRIRVQRLEEEIEVLRRDSSLAKQQASTYKAAADDLKEKLEAAERQKSRGEKDWEQKTRELEDKLTNSQCISRELEHKVDELTLACSRADDVARSLKAESTHLLNDKTLAEERMEFQKRENNVLQETLRTVQEALEKKANIECMYRQTVKKLEDELAHHKQTTTELNQKADDLKSANQRADAIVISIKSELHSVKTEKKMAEQRVDAQRMQVDCLSEQLKKTQEQLIQKAREVQEQEHRARNLQEEVDNGRQVMDDLKLQLTELTEANLVAARTIGELQAELSTAKIEKGVLEEEVKMQQLQMQEFSDKLDQAQQQMRKENDQHRNNWNIQLGSRVEQSNHVAEDLIRQARNCQYYLEWSEAKDQKRVMLEENYYQPGGMRPMISLIELEFSESEPSSQQSILTTQHTAVPGKLTAMQKVPGQVETKYSTIRNKSLEARLSAPVEERRQNITPLRSLKQPSEMAELGLSKSCGKMGKTLKEKETVLFGNESLNNNAKHLGAEQRAFEPSLNTWDAPVSCSDQRAWHKDEGDFVGNRLSKMSISSRTELFSQSAPVKHYSETDVTCHL
ncbi:uncharacterized protein LOC144680624 [Cetorhinus maximus]